MGRLWARESIKVANFIYGSAGKPAQSDSSYHPSSPQASHGLSVARPPWELFKEEGLSLPALTILTDVLAYGGVCKCEIGTIGFFLWKGGSTCKENLNGGKRIRGDADRSLEMFRRGGQLGIRGAARLAPHHFHPSYLVGGLPSLSSWAFVPSSQLLRILVGGKRAYRSLNATILIVQ